MVIKNKANGLIFKSLLRNYILSDNKVINIVNKFNTESHLNYAATICKYLDYNNDSNAKSTTGQMNINNNKDKKTRNFNNQWWEDEDKDTNSKELINQTKTNLFLLQYIKNFIPPEPIPETKKSFTNNIIKKEQVFQIEPNLNFEFLQTTDNNLFFSIIGNDAISPKSDEDFEERKIKNTYKTVKYITSHPNEVLESEDDKDNDGKLNIKFTLQESTISAGDEDGLHKIFTKKLHKKYHSNDYGQKDTIQKNDEIKIQEVNEEIEIKPKKSVKNTKLKISVDDRQQKKPHIRTSGSSTKRLRSVNKISGKASNNIHIRDLNADTEYNLTRSADIFNNSKD